MIWINLLGILLGTAHRGTFALALRGKGRRIKRR